MKSFKLNKKKKKAWLEELRSGLYKQGIRRLYEDGKYCCLGVYIEACGLNWIYNEVIKRWGCEDTYRSSSFLPNSEIPEKIQWKLAAMNDSDKTFDEIANWIEKNL